MASGDVGVARWAEVIVVILTKLTGLALNKTGCTLMPPTRTYCRPRVLQVCPWLESLPRRVLAIPATSAAPERLFSSLGNTMTKKRTRLTCDNLEELVFLHETWPVVREWKANKRVRIDDVGTRGRHQRAARLV